ncbi:MAG: pyrimidine 5'-nucleotidase [Sphingomonas sp.]|jgi:putative hydrolase of the HAD superfamily|uniref:pyrimidine 5'-nucleotidase n=1 Tax=Sphingomonas sp. TaxID=28214 RepID=UPI00356840BA
MLARLGHVRNWIFDLDNTLYPASAQLFARIDAKMTAYIADRFGLDHVAAHRLQKQYFFDHGTTLAGLMARHHVDPHEFLAFVHDIEMDVLEENAPLATAIGRLPGRKFIFTNADAPYAGRVLDRLGLAASFEAIHDIHAMDLRPKPEASAYAGLCAAFGIAPEESLFVEDMARNLAPAKAIGMTTVWIDNGSEQAADADRDHIDFTTHDIRHWLEEILEAA